MWLLPHIGPLCEALDQSLHVACGVFVRAVALKYVADPASAQVRAQLLRQRRENWDIQEVD